MSSTAGQWLSVQICSFCWFQAQGKRQPARVSHPPMERCFDCDQPTNSGIYVRRQEKVRDESVSWYE